MMTSREEWSHRRVADRVLIFRPAYLRDKMPPSPRQYADGVRGENTPQLKSIVIMFSFALLAMLVSATF